MTIKDGFNLCCGVVLFVLVSFGLGWLQDKIYPTAYDDSDAQPLRSGMSIKTDYLTMCQYLITFTGSITPRMGRDGKQVCK